MKRRGFVGFCLAVIVLALFQAVLFGCSSDDAKSMYETAELEELQKNPEHAIELYGDLIKEHPESPYAEKARQRLKELESRP